ncbi:MAG: immune inhibitor A domain-containing protein [Candidatus Latescibacterota bacterium]
MLAKHVFWLILSALCLVFARASTADGADFICAGALEGTEEGPTRAGKIADKVFSSEGNLKVLVLFAKFVGEAHEDTTAPGWAEDLFDLDLEGSLSHFYSEMSRGRLTITGSHLRNRYVSDQEGTYYLAQNDTSEGNYGRFNWEILRKADRDVDFGEYDNDGPDGLPNSGDDDGYVDFVFVNLRSVPRNFLFGPATGIASLGLEEEFITDDPAKDGGTIRIRDGATQRAWEFAVAVGVMAHEFGHALGLRDLYDKSFLEDPDQPPEEDSAGIGRWGLMGHGTLGWNGNDGPTPFCAWSLEQLGWLSEGDGTLVVARSDLPDERIRPLWSGGKVYKMPFAKSEYLLLSNRQRQGSFYDRHIPGDGLLIWRIFVPGENGREQRKQVDLECADGLYADRGYPGMIADPDSGRDNLDFWARDEAYRKDHNGNLGDATDVFDGILYRDFSPSTNPSSHRASGIRITDIRREGEDMVADLRPPGPVRIHSYTIRNEEILGNSGGTAQPGESLSLDISLENSASVSLYGVPTEWAITDPFVRIEGWVSKRWFFGSFPGQSILRKYDAIEMMLIASECPSDHTITVHLSITHEFFAWRDSLKITVSGKDEFPPSVSLDLGSEGSHHILPGDSLIAKSRVVDGAAMDSVIGEIMSLPDSVIIDRVTFLSPQQISPTILEFTGWVPSHHPPGQYAITAVATDAYGNIGKSGQLLFSIGPDVFPPEIRFPFMDPPVDPPFAAVGDSARVTCWVTEKETALESVVAYGFAVGNPIAVDSAVLRREGQSSEKFSGTFSPSRTMEYQIIIVATDLCGNRKTSEAIRFSSVPFRKQSDVLLLPGSQFAQEAYEAALAASSIPYDLWDRSLYGAETESMLNEYLYSTQGIVVGEADATVDGNQYEQPVLEALVDGLDAGGRVFLCAQRIPTQWYLELWERLYSERPGSRSMNQPLFGMPGDPISDGMKISIGGGSYNLLPIHALPPAVPLFKGSDGKTYALRVDTGIYRAVFVATGFRNIDAESRVVLIQRAIEWLSVSTAVTDETIPQAPVVFRLSQNHPNPFNARTVIPFTVPACPSSEPESRGSKVQVELAIHNLLGQRVRTLVDEDLRSGDHQATWNGNDDLGQDVSSGSYFYRLSIDNGKWLETKKMVLIR